MAKIKSRQQWEEEWIGIAQDAYEFYSDEMQAELKQLYQESQQHVIEWLEDVILKAIEDDISRTDIWTYKRYKNFEKKLGIEIANLGGKEYKGLAMRMERALKEVYNSTVVPDTSKGAKSGAVIEVDFNLMNEAAVKQLVNQRWSNKLYSSAIWDNKSLMLNQLKKGLRDVLVLGESKDKLVEHIAQVFNKNFAVADRLVRTELMHSINQGQRRKYKDSNVKKLEIVVVEDNRICDSCEGRSGEIIDIDSNDIPPFHPRCRCCVVAVVDWNAWEVA